MKTKILTQPVSIAVAAGLLMVASTAVMAKSVQTGNPFDMADMNTSNLVMSSGHDHGNDKDEKAEDKSGDDKSGDDKSKGNKEDKKAGGKCGADHMKDNAGKCGGH